MTKQTQHTLGPWAHYRLQSNNIGECLVINSPSHGAIALIPYSYQPEREANANLIAAAPELLEACKELLSIAEGFAACFGNDPDEASLVRKMKAAIAKAEGKGE